MRIARDRIEHRLVCLDAERKRIGAEQSTRHGKVLGTEEQSAGNGLRQFFSRERFRLDEAAIKIERDPRIFSINIAADNVSVIDRQETMLFEEPLTLDYAIGKQRPDFAPVIFPDDAARAIERIGLKNERDRKTTPLNASHRHR